MSEPSEKVKRLVDAFGWAFYNYHYNDCAGNWGDHKNAREALDRHIAALEAVAEASRGFRKTNEAVRQAFYGPDSAEWRECLDAQMLALPDLWRALRALDAKPGAAGGGG